MSPLILFSKHWKQITVLIVMISVVGTVIVKAPSIAARAEADLSGIQHLLHDADTDSREIRPIPLLG